MWVLSRSASTTIAARFWLSFATTSSLTIVGTRGDHPRIRVWPSSTTLLRPRRRASMRWSTADEISPIRLPAMKIPARVTRSPRRRVGHDASEANVPASTARSSICHVASRMPSGLLLPLIPFKLMSAAMTALTTTMASVTRPR